MSRLDGQAEIPVGVVVLCAKVEERVRVETIARKYFRKAAQSIHGFTAFDLPQRRTGLAELLLFGDCGQMANVSAASKTGYVVAKHNPNLIVMVGTAGSLRPDKCKVADVVVPTLGYQTHYYDKIEDAEVSTDGSASTTRDTAHLGANTSDQRTYDLRKKLESASIDSFARSHVSKASAKLIGKGGLAEELTKFGKASRRNPKVHTDVRQFSWDMVLASDHYRSLLVRNIDSKAFAVDMETFGFLNTVGEFQRGGQSRPLAGLVVRGISDICGDKNSSGDDGRNEIATDNAAHVACRIIKHGYLNA